MAEATVYVYKKGGVGGYNFVFNLRKQSLNCQKGDSNELLFFLNFRTVVKYHPKGIPSYHEQAAVMQRIPTMNLVCCGFNNCQYTPAHACMPTCTGTHTCIHTRHMHAHTHPTPTPTHIFMHTLTPPHTCMHTLIPTHTDACTHTHAYTHAHTHLHTGARAHARTHTHIHTHTLQRKPPTPTLTHKHNTTQHKLTHTHTHTTTHPNPHTHPTCQGCEVQSSWWWTWHTGCSGDRAPPPCCSVHPGLCTTRPPPGDSLSPPVWSLATQESYSHGRRKAQKMHHVGHKMCCSMEKHK